MEQLLARYDAFGPSSLGDRRRGNGAPATLLTPEILAKLRERLKAPPDDCGVWTAKKAAAFMAAELGRSVVEQRGWEALMAPARSGFTRMPFASTSLGSEQPLTREK